jgi:hypothetical protein
MKARARSWLERIVAVFLREDRHHRICRLCHRPVKKHERWRQVKVGWFAPVYTVEHRDCTNPLAPARCVPAHPVEPELPFEMENVLYGDVYPTYADTSKEKVQ